MIVALPIPADHVGILLFPGQAVAYCPFVGMSTTVGDGAAESFRTPADVLTTLTTCAAVPSPLVVTQRLE